MALGAIAVTSIPALAFVAAALGGAAAAMTVPARVALVALSTTARSMSWLPLLAGAATAGVGMWMIDPAGGEAPLLAALRLSAFLLAAGGAFALDDPAADTLAASPTRLRARRVHRLVLLGTVWGALWAVALAAAEAVSATGALPVAVTTIEAAGMLALALAAAAVAMPHVAEGRGGVVAGPALTVAMLGALLAQYHYPRWATLFAFSSSQQEWQAARARWVVLLAAAVMALACASLDPARRPKAATVARIRGAKSRTEARAHGSI